MCATSLGFYLILILSHARDIKQQMNLISNEPEQCEVHKQLSHNLIIGYFLLTEYSSFIF